MLHILLLILKIIGILLLILLSLILLIIALALFVPIRYQAEGEKYERIKATADVTWLFRLLRIHVQFSEKKLSYYVRVAWIRLLKSDTEEEPEESTPSIVENNESKDTEHDLQMDTEHDLQMDIIIDEEILEEELQSEEHLNVKILDDSQEQLTSEAVDDSPETVTSEVIEESADQLNMENDSAIETQSVMEAESDTKVSIWENIRNFKKKISDFFTNTQKKKEDISKKTDKLKRKLGIYYRFLTHNITKAALNHIKKEVFYLLRHYLPRKLGGEVYIGFADPATTGKVIGYLSVLNTLLNQPLIVRFNFEEKVLEGHLKIKGHIRACHVIKAGIALLIDRNIWKTYKRFQKIRKVK